jgi:site-specific DNA-methyltransferase (adenine-specific)
MEINKIWIENCLNTINRLPDESIDLVVTSPPYDDLRTYNGYSFDFENVAKNLFRVMKKGATIIWIVGDSTKNGSETGTSFKQALFFKEVGFNLHDTMIWQKTNPMPKVKTKRYFDVFEYMFVLTKGQPKTFNPIMQPTKFGGKIYDSTVKKIGTGKERVKKKFVLNSERYKNNIWECAVAQNKTAHSAVFPEQLVQDHISTWSKEGDVVYDPFIGSGTTAIVARKLNRNYLGSEISEDYAKLAIKRLNES